MQSYSKGEQGARKGETVFVISDWPKTILCPQSVFSQTNKNHTFSQGQIQVPRNNRHWMTDNGQTTTGPLCRLTFAITREQDIKLESLESRTEHTD